MHSIRLKITAVTIAAILTSLFVLGVIGVATIGRESDQTSAEKMEIISENMQLLLDAYLDSIEQSVQMSVHVAGDTLAELNASLLGDDSPEAKAKLDAILRSHCNEIEHAFSNIAGETSGIITYYYCVNADLGSGVQGFFWSRYGQESFTRQPDLNSNDLDINDTDHTLWYYSPLKAGRAVWVGPYKAHYLDELWTISYVAPVYKSGFLVGVLGMDIPFDTLIDQISSLKVYDTGFVFLMDKDGRALYHPTLAPGEVPNQVGLNLNDEIFRHRNSGRAMLRYRLGGERRQLAFSTLNNGIKVAVTAPVSEITASQRHMMAVLLGVTFVILAVFVVVTLLAMDAITRPLQELTKASRRLMAGDYEVELGYDREDEVGTLTAAFRQLRDHLKLYISDLNSRAYTDAMTGVRNKGAFSISLARLNDEIRLRQGKSGIEFAIIILDCNNLKQINDEFGHSRGDVYLQNACRAICRTFKHSPVFRLGGDEFGVILQRGDYQNRYDLLCVFDRTAEEVNESAQEPWERVSISKGMAEFAADADENAEQVLQRADELMYEDKRFYKQSLRA